mmetsp:Transcript_39240/g.54496  ORF Transcript_39240/g.54496 Transcript_39240/m.54496 type:complete len:124 (-) Transcript_39240:318-689(-)
MGRPFLLHLEGNAYSCRSCKVHLALAKDLISKAFHCRSGRAYLFDRVVNVSLGPLEERLMTTGSHTVSDVLCNRCNRVVGWRYEEAVEKDQKYKEGKFILGRAEITDSRCGPFGSDMSGSDCE